MTLEEIITISGAVSIAAGGVAAFLATLLERHRVRRKDAREAELSDEDREHKRQLSFSEAEAELRTWLVELNEKRDAENEKLRKDLRAVEQLLREESTARFDDRREIDRLTGIVARHEETIEHQQGEIDHLKTQFDAHKITPAPFFKPHRT